MTDAQWKKIIIKCRKSGDEHRRLLKIAEKEYHNRYGKYPSEVEDDWWIDSLHYCQGSIDLEEIKSNAELHLNR